MLTDEMKAAGWVFQFEAPIGARVMHRFIGVEAGDLWWSFDERRWSDFADRQGWASTIAPCHSFRAFKRHLRKHGDTFAGRKIRLCSRFVGHDIIAYKPETPHD